MVFCTTRLVRKLRKYKISVVVEITKIRQQENSSHRTAAFEELYYPIP
jgi:hypothetical protein